MCGGESDWGSCWAVHCEEGSCCEDVDGESGRGMPLFDIIMIIFIFDDFNKTFKEWITAIFGVCG